MISCHRFKTGQVRPANITTAAFYMRKVIKMVVYVFFHLQVFRLFCITPFIFPAIILWQYILAGDTFVAAGGGSFVKRKSYPVLLRPMELEWLAEELPPRGKRGSCICS